MRYLSLEEILTLHQYQIVKYGGKEGVRNPKLLESAVVRPQASFSGRDLHQGVFVKAAVLAFGIIQNHPFYDANKRTAMHAMLAFLQMNNKKSKLVDKQLTNLAMKIAQNKISVKELARILEKN